VSALLLLEAAEPSRCHWLGFNWPRGELLGDGMRGTVSAMPDTSQDAAARRITALQELQRRFGQPERWALEAVYRDFYNTEAVPELPVPRTTDLT
jgi:hypothetical protein